MDIQIVSEIIWITALAVYTFVIIFITKQIFDYFVYKKHMNKNVIVYYNRKFIHIFAGGIVVLAVPFVFSKPYLPLLASILITLIMLFFHNELRKFLNFKKHQIFNPNEPILKRVSEKDKHEWKSR